MHQARVYLDERDPVDRQARQAYDEWLRLRDRGSIFHGSYGGLNFTGVPGSGLFIEIDLDHPPPTLAGRRISTIHFVQRLGDFHSGLEIDFRGKSLTELLRLIEILRKEGLETAERYLNSLR